MTASKFTAVFAALVLGAGAAAACGDGDNESVNQGNEGQKTAQGSPSTVETNPTTLGSTGTQPTVTQGQGGVETEGSESGDDSGGGSGGGSDDGG